MRQFTPAQVALARFDIDAYRHTIGHGNRQPIARVREIETQARIGMLSGQFGLSIRVGRDLNIATRHVQIRTQQQPQQEFLAHTPLNQLRFAVIGGLRLHDRKILQLCKPDMHLTGFRSFQVAQWKRDSLAFV